MEQEFIAGMAGIQKQGDVKNCWKAGNGKNMEMSWQIFGKWVWPRFIKSECGLGLRGKWVWHTERTLYSSPEEWHWNVVALTMIFGKWYTCQVSLLIL